MMKLSSNGTAWFAGLALAALVYIGLANRIKKEEAHRRQAFAGAAIFALAFVLLPPSIWGQNHPPLIIAELIVGAAGGALLLLSERKR
jgi:peptidoglycan/LPS O-acetylase OafA/YrhL